MNEKELPKSRALAAKVIYAAFQALKENGGELPRSQVFDEVERRTKLDDWARERYEKTGYLRWRSVLQFFAIDCVKAGFLVRKKAVWYLTPEGEAALQLGERGLLEAAMEAYRKWRQENPRTKATIPEEHEKASETEGIPMEEYGQEIEFDAPLEEEVEETDVQGGRNKIFTEQGDPEIESLHNKWKRGKLVIQPDFQRQFVWDLRKSSRLIESALLDIPLPVVYISQEKDGNQYVIDGQQRLTSFFSFIDGTFPGGNDFRLSDLKVYPEYNRKRFSEIPEELQDKVRYCKIRTITFRKESDPNLKFEIFERLNTGSVSLNDQELRTCIYRGPYNKLLRQLAVDKDFTDMMGISKPEKRMKDIELVLRFAAFYHHTYLNYRPPIRSFLNREMERYQFISDSDASELTQAFKNSISIINSLLGKNAFKRYYKGSESDPNGHWEPKKFNASLYDILMYSFAKEGKNEVYPNLDAIQEALIYLMTSDQEFIDSIELSTSSVQAVTKRFDKWRIVLKEIIGIQHKEPRCFSYALKKEMFSANSTCEICGQKIQLVDDAALDHIEQFWRGGKTVPENARLTHRYCNWSRPRKD